VGCGAVTGRRLHPDQLSLLLFAARERPRFAKEVPAGPERLVRELIRRGLREDCYVAAARLALELEQTAKREASA
jgi:hypothetical protein